MVCARLFLAPLIHAMLGRRALRPVPHAAILAEPLEANGPRQHYLRGVSWTDAEGRVRARAHESQDSSQMRLLAESDCLIVRAPDAPAARPGEPIALLPLDF
jgi:molybdopterin molybdotransferase